MSRRGNPERFLGQAELEEARLRRGRLRIFFGMAPGVGKTFAMLTEAHRIASQGADVVVGVVETHGRAETEQLLLGLDIVPLRSVEYRGTTLRELDLDAALRRRPEVLLVDELAHTNAPGSRFEKRFLDIQACLDVGINVWTTLNVQHIESLNDVVAQITGVKVRETVPDSVLEAADEIEVVDLPPDALLDRLRSGKVYLPVQIEAARSAFFRKGNLTALRELALRHAATLVDRQLQQEKSGQGVRTAWPTADRIMVCVGASPTSRRLLRAARRLAAGLRVELLAVHVESPRSAEDPRVVETMRLARHLGAEPITISVPAGSTPTQELVHLARSRNVSKIVIGRTGRSRLATALFGSFADDLIRRSEELSIYIMRGDELDETGEVETRRDEAAGTPFFTEALDGDPRRFGWSAFAGAVAISAIASFVAWLVYEPPDLSDEAMVYVTAVVLAAWRLGRRGSVCVALLSVLSFNFLFTEPRFTLMVDDPRQLVTLGVMLVVGVTVGTLTARLRDQADEARERERRAAALSALTHDLAQARDAAEVAVRACRNLAETFDADTVITEVPRRDAPAMALVILGSAGVPDWFDERERAVARWALDHGRTAGLGTAVLPGGLGRLIPLDAQHGRVGCLAVRPRKPKDLLRASSLLLLEAFAAQIALALERVALIEDRQRARMSAESERLRSALLSSVSHDLRTPLAAIAGSAAVLRESESDLDAETRHELLQSIVDESGRLADLVSNLVFATRLEQGIELRREWTTVEEIVGAGLAPLRAELARRPFRATVPKDLPLVRVDNAMLPQVVKNLVENAIRHTDPSTRIDLAAWREDDRVVVRVSDEGPGLAQGDAEAVFERFYRGRSERRGEPGGLGLGLTICRGIIAAHGGRIWAQPNSPHGVAFIFNLPIEAAPPTPARESDSSCDAGGDASGGDAAAASEGPRA